MIRPAAPDDTPALLALALGAGSFAAEEVEALREALDHAHGGANVHVAVAIDTAGRTIGFAAFAPSEMAERLWYLWWAAVEPESQSQGIGASLLAHVEAVAREQEARLLLIETTSHARSESVRSSYRACGYTQTARITDYFRDGEDLLLFAKRLTPAAAPPEQAPSPVRPGPHPASLDFDTLKGQCSLKFTRRSGPGGQNRNKVETAVVLLHRPTGIGAEASEQRSQGENLKAAVARLRTNLALGIRSERPPWAVPSPLWKSRCRDGQVRINPHHEDHPTLIAEALDVLHAAGHDPKVAASTLGCSPTQLVKLLRGEPRALLLVNEARKRSGLHPLV